MMRAGIWTNLFGVIISDSGAPDNEMLWHRNIIFDFV